jgi:hypothetical protein
VGAPATRPVREAIADDAAGLTGRVRCGVGVP